MLPSPEQRPLGIILTSVTFLLEGILLQGMALFAALLSSNQPTLRQVVIAAGYGLFLALPFVTISVGLLNRRKWAYWGAVLLCGLIILSIPGWQLISLMLILPPQLFMGSYLLMNDGAKAFFR
ncbi:MAG: hypothetical protein GXP37_15340, partial [Chloroflexi bacterium]|nr:hypothetical protein [Chloroflexota bacterium]